MNEQKNLDLVRRGYEAFGRGDIATLLALLAEDVEWTSPGPPDLPTAGTRRGRQEVAAFFAALDQLFDIQRFEPKAFIAEGDRVVVLGSDTSRVKGTGRVIENEWAHAFTLQQGKVVAFHEYMDTDAIVRELHAAHAKA